MNIELYIGDRLCDIGNPENLGIYLKRVFIKPSELSVKDAQKSYEISLPATATNNEIFNYTNVEEVQGKFKVYDKARLYIDGILILDGKFRMSQITRDAYIGNLGVPAAKTVKDIFGETMMNQAGKWLINNFTGFDSISNFNTDNYDKNKYGNIAPVIFPLALYNLLPKSPKENGVYTDKDLYDKSVTLGMEDFFPSVNAIQMLQKIFENAKYTLTGSAVNDERLKSLYVSYKNPNDYEFDWGVSSMILTGSWRHYRSQTGEMETKFSLNQDKNQYTCNVFDSKNNASKIESDAGGNIRRKDTRTSIIIPRTGLYKIRLYAYTAMLDDNKNFIMRTGVRSGTLNNAPIEIQLVKNLDKPLSEINFNNKFSLDNINQNINDENAIFPQPHKVNFIDPKTDKNFLCGFSFGRHSDENYRNPLNGDNCNPMAISGGRSWDFDSGNGVTDRTYSAVHSPNYKTRNGVSKDKFTVNLQNADTATTKHNDKIASGLVMQVVWLEKGDVIDLITITNYSWGIPYTYIYGYNFDYRLEIVPFYHYIEWLKIDNYGNSTKTMDWNDKGTFIENQIDLIKALPSEIKINDWIDNFCKAFNLILYNAGKNTFRLDIKDKVISKNTSIIIDLDKKANVCHRTNQPLNLPYMYELGFTVDTNEEGYYQSIKEFNEHGEPILSSGDNGGGTFLTGSYETNTIQQTSTFSYCWYKNIRYEKDGSVLSLPVITDHEVWENDYDYKEMLSKSYLDKNQRFWYKSGVKNLDLGLDRTATAALVSNEYNGMYKQKLDYKDEPNSIMSNYFLLLTNQKCYTIVECYLTPTEYNNLGVALVLFNGDIYKTTEIDGYDPLSRKKSILKLIKKIS
jgi:hypothetical protein